MESRSGSLVEVGKIVGTHGLRGDLKVRSGSGDPEILLTAEQFTLHLPSGERLTAKPVRQSLHKGQVLLRLQGYESINQVEAMVGGQVLLPAGQLPELADDEYYWSQLQGLQVVDRARGPIGRIEQLYETAAHDTYLVQGEYGEVLIPAVGRFVLQVDLVKQLMQVDLPDGLIPDKDDL